MSRIRWTVGDVLAGIVLVAIIAVLGMSGQAKGVNAAARVKCVSNLHQLGLACLLYQNDNNGYYPRGIMEDPSKTPPVWGTPYQADPSIGPGTPDPFAGPGQPAPNDITGAFFLLLREEKLTPSVFVCPESMAKGWDFGGGSNTAQNWVNWAGKKGLAKHLSYSYMNVYGSNDAVANGFQIKNPDATYAVASDMNPGGEAVLKVKIDSAGDVMKAANSFNHGQDGQNVLFGDCHAEWETNPFCGSQHDNIFTAAGPEVENDPGRGTAVIVASPVSNTDSVLLPTAADIGYHARVTGKPLTVAERDALAAKLIGKYQVGGNAAATLTVTAKTMTSTAGPDPIDYKYEIIGGTGDTLVCRVTSGDTSWRGTVRLDTDGELDFELLHADAALDQEWTRVKEDKPAAGH